MTDSELLAIIVDGLFCHGPETEWDEETIEIVGNLILEHRPELIPAPLPTDRWLRMGLED